MKILILSSSFPYPIDIGRKSVMAGFLTYLIQEHGADNIVYVTSDVEADPSLAPFEVLVLPQASSGERGFSVVANSLLRRRMPIQEAILCGSETVVTECVDRVRPDLLFVDTIRMMHYAEPFLRRMPSIIYLDDLYSLRYQRMLRIMEEFPQMEINAVGTFSRFLPEIVLPLVQMGQKFLLQFEAGLLRQREIEAAQKFGTALLINREEAKKLSVASQRTVTPVKMLHITRRRLPRQFSGEPHFLFLGNLLLPSNSIALTSLLDAMPEIIRSIPNVRVNVVGRGASTVHRDRAAVFGSHLCFLDFVDDLEALFASSAALLAPIIFGGGIKIKILDALAYGLPVLGTTTAFDGIPHGRHFVIEDDLAHWGRHMRSLLDLELNSTMSASAIACYDAEFSPAVVREQYRRIFKSRDLPRRE